MESAENQGQSPKANQQEAESSDSESLSKIETLKLLNDSIDRLEQTIKGISENSADDLPSSDSISTLVSTTQKLADDVATPAPVANETPAEETESEPAPQEIKPTSPQAMETPLVEEQDQAKEEKTVVNHQKKQNFSLIALVLGAIAIVIIAIFWLWLPQQQTSLSSIPETLTTEIIPDNEVNPDLEGIKTPVINPEVNIPETNNLETSLDSTTVENDLSADTEIVDSELETPPETSIPQDLAAPGRAKNLKIVTVQPELTFTPEQTLIAVLQTKVAQLTKDYATDFVDSIKVDLLQSSLLVKVKDNWYEMNESRQNKLANEMLKRSRNLNFTKLELKDSTGTLVARNPVVGDQIIIIQSSQNNEQVTISH